MLEPPGTNPRQAAADTGTDLLATKFYLPRPPQHFVPRPRLAALLDEGVRRELTLVCAPAGFGKTALVGNWCRQRSRPVGWVSLDAGDNDPVRFWRHAIAALDRVRPGTAERLGPLLGSASTEAVEASVIAIVNWLAADRGDEVILVLDDYHLIDAESVHHSLLTLLEHAPICLHIVLASRHDPQLPLARLRARGQLAEVRAADLRFTVDEAAELMQQEVGLNLTAEAVARLAHRTEGWIAGLQLTALSLEGRTDANQFVDSFSGSHRFILDYLSEEVLDRQPEQLRDFLLETSILERLSGPLCDAITLAANSQYVLEKIEADNLFLTPLDEVRGWWRYHQLFADLLRARLQQHGPERAAELHRRAAAWHHQHGQGDEAVRHALAAEDGLWAARLVESYADEFLLRGETETLRRWMAALPGELVAARPRLLIDDAAIALQTGRTERMADLLDAAERVADNVADEPYEPSTGRGASVSASIPAAIALLRAGRAGWRGDATATTRFAAEARAEAGDGEWLLELLSRWHLTIATWLQDQPADAERAFASHISEWAQAGELVMSSRDSLFRGQIQCARGRPDAAIETYQAALTLTTPPDQPPLPAAGFAYVGLGAIAYQRNSLDSALTYVNEGIALCRHLTVTHALALGLANAAMIQQANGDPVRARESMEEAALTGPSGSVTCLLNPVPALRARLLLMQGDLDAAERWLSERAIGPGDDGPTYPEEAAYLVLARVLLARSKSEQATRILDRLHQQATASRRLGSLIEIQSLRALALADGGDEHTALTALGEALTLANSRGYVRVFVDDGPAMATLLGRFLADQDAARSDVPVSYLGELVRAFERPTAAGTKTTTPTVAAGMITQLTDRELDVLRLLAAGSANGEIASELFVSLNTVKKHVTHIFDKLGATNRTEATHRARALGILE